MGKRPKLYQDLFRFPKSTGALFSERFFLRKEFIRVAGKGPASGGKKPES